MTRSRSITPSIILLAAFLSGFTALLYQVVWIRRFGQVFGLQVITMSIVLATFMLGLSLGSYVIGRWSDRFSRFRLYIFLEVGLALFALFFNDLFGLLTRWYAELAAGPPDLSGSVQYTRMILSFLFLLFPSLLIGGTLPVLVKIAVARLDTAGMRISRIYAINNLGAFAGAFATGFFLVRYAGITTTLHIGAMVNIITAVLVTGIAAMSNFNQPVSPEQRTYHSAYTLPPGVLRRVLIVFLLEGFTTLAYEVLWTRVFVEFSYDKTTYLYTVIIMAFIFGLSAGAMVIGRRVDRLRNPAVFVGKLQLGIAFLAIFQVLLALVILPMLLRHQSADGTWFRVAGTEYLFVFLFLLAPVVLMGMTFPVVARIMASGLSRLGSRMGVVGLLDTLGSVVGSLAAGLLLLPMLGVVRSIFFVAAVNLVCGLLLYRSERKILKQPVSHVALVTLFLAALVLTPKSGEFKSKLGRKLGESLVHFEEASCGTVSVHEYPMGYRALSINSVLFAYNTEDDLRSHSMLAYMPYLFHPDPHNALVLGFGLGITASCFDQPEIDSIDVAEICPAVIRASGTWFAAANDDVLHNEKLNLIIDDGRSWMEITEKKYDLITCDAIHPRYGNNLYTKEYYELCRARLSADGAVCQWMPTNWLSDDEYKALLATFVSVFPHASLWYVNRGVTLIVGTKDDRLLDMKLLTERTHRPSMIGNLRKSGIQYGEEVLGYYLMKDDAISAFAGEVLLNTDDRPYVEFSEVVSMAPNTDVLQRFMVMEPDLKEIVDGEIGDITRDVIAMKRAEVKREIRKDLEMISGGH